MLHSSTPGVEKHLAEKNVSAYIGFDPTASSLHVGSLLPIMALVHFQRAGHSPIAIAGGGTGLIGDPSGKTQERKLLTKEDLEANLIGIKEQLSHFLDFKAKSNPARLINNADWLVPLSLMDFLRDIGKHFSVNELMAKDSVKSRLENEQGMSVTEFSYSLLQAYDFLMLNQKQGCTLQMGGSDQWGNIVAGIDLIRKKTGKEAHGIVFHLITTSSGTKFGKTESGTIWLDPARTSPYKFYQFWYNTEDADVSRYLRFFTLLEKQEIESLESALRESPGQRVAQKALAHAVTTMVHGESAAEMAVKGSRAFFSSGVKDLDERVLEDVFDETPSILVTLPKIMRGEVKLLDLLVQVNMVKSKGEGRKLSQSGGIYVNDVRVDNIEEPIGLDDFLFRRFLILRKGTKNHLIVRAGLPINALNDTIMGEFTNVGASTVIKLQALIGAQVIRPGIDFIMTSGPIRNVAQSSSDGSVALYENFNQFLWCFAFRLMVQFEQKLHQPNVIDGHFSNLDLIDEAERIFEAGKTLLVGQDIRQFIGLPDPTGAADEMQASVDAANSVYSRGMKFIMYHEIAHQLYGHTQAKDRGTDPLEREWAADDFAVGVLSSDSDQQSLRTSGYGIVVGLSALAFVNSGFAGGSEHPDVHDRILKALAQMNLPKTSNVWGVASMALKLWFNDHNVSLELSPQYQNYEELFRATILNVQASKRRLP
jgi:tyrosyl-tRNA synthetase